MGPRDTRSSVNKSTPAAKFTAVTDIQRERATTADREKLLGCFKTHFKFI